MQGKGLRVLASRDCVRSAALLVLGSAMLVPAMAKGAVIADGGFETPALPGGTFAYSPSGSPWTFGGIHGSIISGGSGVMNHALDWPTPTPVDGAQVAFIQSAQGVVGSLTQSVTLDHAGTYELRYSVAGRSGPAGEGGHVPFTVSYGGTVITSDASMDGQPFTLKTVQFSAPAGTADLVIQGFAPVPDTNLFRDNTAFFDAISIVEVPEPAMAGVMMVVLGGVMSGRRRK